MLSLRLPTEDELNSPADAAPAKPRKVRARKSKDKAGQISRRVPHPDIR